MAFKQISDLSADTTISLGGTNRKTGKKNPVSVEGYYLGSRTVADAKKKSGQSFIYFFQTAQGNVGVWGKTDMDRKLASATPGNMVRVSFDRMVPTPNGEMYKYKVEQDADNTIEVDTPRQAAPAQDETEDSSVNSFSHVFGADEDLVQDEDDQDDAIQAAALAAAERKAKVQALLNKNKSAKN